jgi:hypothetical protein
MARPATVASLLLAGAIALGAAPADAFAQDRTPNPPARPSTGDPSLDRAAEELERAAAPRPAVDPLGTDRAGADLAQTRAAARLLPEGTFLPSRRGRLVSAGAHHVFVAAPPTDGQADPPLIVQPNEWLASMERQLAERGADTEFVVSGTVQSYRGRNYLLITAAPIVSAPSAPSAAEPGAPPAHAAPPTTIADAEVEKILAELRDAGGGGGDRRSTLPLAPPARREAAPGAPAAAGPRPALLPEGTFLAARRGRLVRSAAGEWLFVVDSGAEGVAEPPMLLLPCRNLAAMERLAEQRGDAVTFTVSGQVFVYRDRNCLLPVMYVLNRRTDEVLPTQ